MTKIYVAGASAEQVRHAFDGGDEAVALAGDAAAELKAADGRGERYVLVHVGADDGVAGGSYERAHHRVALAELPELAKRLKSRQRLLVRTLSFGYKNGLPADADWVIDCRFLDNPYWDERLRPLDGRDEPVSAHVLADAGGFVDSLLTLLGDLLARYRSHGREVLTVAFGCTGGRHRSVVIAEELAARLRERGDVDVEVSHREL